MTYYSQYGQDRYIHERFFRGLTSGHFIEVGALDGLLHSNTLFFERELGWQGILVEPNPVAFALLQKNRPSCLNENVALYEEDGSATFTQISGDFYGWSGLSQSMEAKHIERINKLIPNTFVSEIQVVTKTAKTLLAEHGLSHLDLVSVDIEGAEEMLLRSFPWGQVTVSVFCIENNFGRSAVQTLIEPKGYVKVAHIGTDDIYAWHELV